MYLAQIIGFINVSKLKITISGDAMELAVGNFPKEGADWIMSYYE